MAEAILVGAAAVALYCFVGAVVGVLVCYVVAPRVLGYGAEAGAYDFDVVGASFLSGFFWPVALPAWLGAAVGFRLTRRLRERGRSRG